MSVNTFQKWAFIALHEVGCHGFYKTYKNLLKNQYKTYEELKKEQERKLQEIINFAYRNVPYYHSLFKTLQLHPSDIKNIENLEKLPIITKDIIKEHWEDFKPINLREIKYYNRATGGSTGRPFQYRLDKFNRFLSWALIYRGWGYAGYELGDPMIFFGGASLRIVNGQSISQKIQDVLRNIRRISSFDISEKNLNRYMMEINSFKPKYIYGYASSLYFLSNWIEKNWDKDVHSPIGIFTTAEKLYPYMRKKIENVFDTEVFDNYGLNDGGVSAYECKEHQGLHIDMERAVMEIADKEGHQIENGEGKIIATSLYNYSLPFIRYDTGDIGIITSEKCGCGRPYKLLKEIKGREQEMLITPEGKFIHGEYFTHIFWEIPYVKEFQIVQEKIDKIVIKIVPDENFDEKYLNKIKEIIRMRSKSWNIEFKIVDKINRTKAGKYKFVINEVINK